MFLATFLLTCNWKHQAAICKTCNTKKSCNFMINPSPENPTSRSRCISTHTNKIKGTFFCIFADAVRLTSATVSGNGEYPAGSSSPSYTVNNRSPLICQLAVGAENVWQWKTTDLVFEEERKLGCGMNVWMNGSC